VAEWQTRQTQNLLSERTWEFKSPRPHHGEACPLASAGIRARDALAGQIINPVGLLASARAQRPSPLSIYDSDAGDVRSRKAALEMVRSDVDLTTFGQPTSGTWGLR
jgi:hypothetical protein